MTLKCMICLEEAEFIAEGYSLCEECWGYMDYLPKGLSMRQQITLVEELDESGQELTGQEYGAKALEVAGQLFESFGASENSRKVEWFEEKRTY